MSRDLNLRRRAVVETQVAGSTDREHRHPRRVPVQARELEIGDVAEHCRDGGQLAEFPLLEWMRFLLQQPLSRIAGAIEDLGEVRREGLHEGRVENRTGTSSHAVDGQLRAAEIVENHRVRGEVSDSGSGRDRVLSELLRPAVTVPPLRDLVQGALHAGADAYPTCDPAPDLAARRVVAGAERGAVTH